MRLEDEIQQNVAFSNEQAKAMVNLIFTYHKLKARIAETLKEKGLTMQQYNVLRIVKGGGAQGVTTSEIRERMLDKMSDASRMVDRLAALGWVEKVRDRSDRRLLFIHLTLEGEKLVNEQVRQSEIDAIASGFSQKNAQQLNELLDEFRSHL